MRKRLYVKTFDWTCNILQLRFSHPNIFASQIFAFCIFASASHLRTFTPQIVTSQIFIFYTFTSADRRISDLHISSIVAFASHVRNFTSQILTSQIVLSYIFASASHLRIFISQIFKSSDFHILKTTSCLHIFGSSSSSRTVLFYHLQD